MVGVWGCGVACLGMMDSDQTVPSSVEGEATPLCHHLPLDCWVFFGHCLFVFQAAFVKFRSSRSTSFGVRYPRAE